jgi:hypothetical protein
LVSVCCDWPATSSSKLLKTIGGNVSTLPEGTKKNISQSWLIILTVGKKISPAKDPKKKMISLTVSLVENQSVVAVACQTDTTNVGSVCVCVCVRARVRACVRKRQNEKGQAAIVVLFIIILPRNL